MSGPGDRDPSSRGQAGQGAGGSTRRPGAAASPRRPAHTLREQQHTDSGERAAPAPPARRARTLLVAAAVLAVYAWSLEGTNFSLVALWHGLGDMADIFRRMWPPQWSYLRHVRDPLLETIRIAVVSTLLGAAAAVPASLLTARNVVRSPWLVYPVRAVLNLIRTVPDLLWAALFVAVFGVGPLAGAAALAVFSFSVLAKLAGETVEAIDPGPIEALEASGANRAQLVAFAVVPQVAPQFVAHTLYVFEVNIRVAAVLGLVGAGGIGLLLRRDMDFLWYDRAAVTILVTFVIVAALDWLSARLRERLV